MRRSTHFCYQCPTCRTAGPISPLVLNQDGQREVVVFSVSPEAPQERNTGREEREEGDEVRVEGEGPADRENSWEKSERIVLTSECLYP